ncbi:MAG: hypothetical protein QOD76_1970 [Solirubrobacteraceae bacterium]|nr:hypothetical protein [Solirubrobacteraceae bacterium]
MRTSTFAVAASAATALAASAPAALAAPPTPHQLTISAAPSTVVFGKSVAITGKLTGTNSAGETITLSDDPFPFGNFQKLATTSAAVDGAYALTAFHTVNTRYETDAKSKSPATSPIATVLVAPKVGLRVSDKTPAAGHRVTFKGTVTPAHDGQTISLQRRTSSGKWKTVATSTLTDAGTAFSRYSLRRKVSSSGTYRVLKPADADHARGQSSKRRLTVH